MIMRSINNPFVLFCKKHAVLLSLFIITTLGIALYANTLHYALHFDDTGSIITNTSIHDLANWRMLIQQHPTRAITYLTFALNYRLHGLHVEGYHIVNIAIHISTAICVYWFILLTFVTPHMRRKHDMRFCHTTALLGTLLFVAHPIQTQAVTYIVQRLASLAALWYMLSCCLYISARLKHTHTAHIPIIRYIAACLAAILALLSKETALTLPVIICLYELFFFDHSRKKIVSSVSMCIPFMILAIVWVMRFVRMSYIFKTRIDWAGNVITPYRYALTQLHVVVTYIRLLLIPIHQNLDYDYPITRSFFNLPTIACALLLAGIIMLAIILFKKHRMLSFGITWFFITLALESSIFPIADVIFEHRLYVPMVGLCLCLPELLGKIKNKNKAVSFVVLCLCYISSLSVLTYARNNVWKTDKSLWADVIKKSPHKIRPYINYGYACTQEKNYPDALRAFDQAINTYDQKQRSGLLPDDINLQDSNIAGAYANRGFAYATMGNVSAALADYAHALSIDPHHALTYFNRGTLYLEQEKYEDAISDFEHALYYKPYFVEGLLNCGIAYSKKGDQYTAIMLYEKGIALDNTIVNLYIHRGISRGIAGQLDAAIEDFNRALVLDANNEHAKKNLVFATHLQSQRVSLE